MKTMIPAALYTLLCSREDPIVKNNENCWFSSAFLVAFCFQTTLSCCSLSQFLPFLFKPTFQPDTYLPMNQHSELSGVWVFGWLFRCSLFLGCIPTIDIIGTIKLATTTKKRCQPSWSLIRA